MKLDLKEWINKMTKSIHPDMSQVTLSASLTSGAAAVAVTSVGGWYCVKAINRNGSGDCSAFILDSSNSTYLSASTSPASTFVRATTDWLYFPKGATFYARAFFTDSSESGLFFAPPMGGGTT